MLSGLKFTLTWRETSVPDVCGYAEEGAGFGGQRKVATSKPATVTAQCLKLSACLF